MLLHEVTGRQLSDARQALGFSLSGLAVRAGINRVCIRIYESHGDDVPNAHTHALGRLTRALAGRRRRVSARRHRSSLRAHTMRTAASREPAAAHRRYARTMCFSLIEAAD